MEELGNRYEHVDCRKSEGAHYTSSRLSSYIAKQMVTAASLDKRKTLTVADPAIGDGELIISLLQEIGHTDQIIEVFAFDINKRSLEKAKQRITYLYPNIRFHSFLGDFLVTMNTPPLHKKTFDLIIANPPYVRTQIMGTEKSHSLAKQFDLKGRVDLYQAFLVVIDKFMSETSVAGFVVSNRFLTTKGSAGLRQTLNNQYDIHHIVDFGDTKLFESAVLPAVMIFSKKLDANSTYPTRFSSVYESEVEDLTNQLCETPVDALEFEGIIPCANGRSYLVKHGQLTYDNVPTNVWRIQDEESTSWLATVEANTYCRFKDIGKVRVGIKTTADKVFIKSDWNAEVGYTPECITPLITHHVAGRYRQSDEVAPKQVLYTHTSIDGKKRAIELDHFPLAKQYLLSHKEQLAGRNYIKKAKREWFEIWVPQNPDLWGMPKLVFRDICEQPTFWMDTSGAIVNGDCYWITKDNKAYNDDILYLVMAVANSTFIERYYDTKFNNKLYANKRRFMSQYVENFPLPDPNDSLSETIIGKAKHLTNDLDKEEREYTEREIDQLVFQSFGFIEKARNTPSIVA